MKLKTRIGVAFVLIVFTTILLSADQTGKLDVGNQTCAQFTSDYKDNPTNMGKVYLSWAEGFMTGTARAEVDQSEVETDIKQKGFGVYSQKSFLREYCSENPSNRYSDAVLALYKKIVGESSLDPPSHPEKQRNAPATSVQSSEASLLIYDGFETGGLDGWNRQTEEPGSIRAMPAQPARAGDKAMQFIVEKDAPWIANGPRSELFPSKRFGYWKEGEEYWVGASVMFPIDYQDDPMQEIFWQVHAATRGRDTKVAAVPFFFQSVEDKILIRGRSIETTTIQKTKGKWMDFVVHHVWSSKDQGVTQVWVNGELLVDAQGITTMIEGDNLYWKFGLYKSGWKRDSEALSTVDRREIWYDEVRLGGPNSGYDAVTPR